MSERPPHSLGARAPALLVALATALAGFGTARALYAIASRAAYPYHLEFLESNLVSHAADLAAGGPLYGNPSRDFVPHEYGPLHPSLLSLLFRATGTSFVVARAVSTLAALGTAAVLGRWAWVAGGRVAALLAPLVFFALFGACGAWYDLARVDSLAIFLLVAGAARLHGRRPATRPGKLAAIGLLAAAAFTKQTTLPIAAVAILAAPLALRVRVALLAWLAGAVLLAGAGLHAATGGRFLLFTVLIPASHPLHWELWIELVRALSSPPLLAIPFVVAACALARVRPSAAPEEIGRSRREAILLAAALAVSIVTLFKEGAWINDLMPAAAFGSLAAGIALGRGLRGSIAPGAAAIAALLVAAVPFAGRFDAGSQVPTKDDRRAGDAIVAYLRAFPGRFWVADFNYLGVLARRPPLPTAYAVGEIVEPLGRERQDLRDLDEGRFDMVLADPSTPRSFRARLERAYRRSPTMPSLPVDLRTRVGQPMGLAEVWVPRAREVSLPAFPVPSGAPR